jgi:hypothetical protein
MDTCATDPMGCIPGKPALPRVIFVFNEENEVGRDKGQF